jgi:hypothetical protein
MHPVRRKAEAERDDLGQVVRAFEEEAEEAPHPRAAEEGVVSSEEIELEEKVVRGEDGGDGGDPVHLEALLMEEELEARHLGHYTPRVLRTRLRHQADPMDSVRAPRSPFLHDLEGFTAELCADEGRLGWVEAPGLSPDVRLVGAAPAANRGERARREAAPEH